MPERIRQLKIRLRIRIENFKNKPYTSRSLAVDDAAPSKQVTSDSRQVPAGSIEKEDRAEGAESSGNTDCSVSLPDSSSDNTASLAADDVDISDWAGIWSEAYKTVKGNTEYLSLLENFEAFLEKGEGRTGNDDLADSLSLVAEDENRLKNIQKIAREKLDSFSEAQLSLAIGKKSIVVRDSIVKIIKVINTLKPIIGGAAAAEPSAALAWAGVTTVLPMFEIVFQQDEDAATGLAEIIFLMARYQMLHEDDFSTGLGSTGHSRASRELLTHFKQELISIYADIYVYEARFILQYATRGKVHRAFRNAFTVDDWKSLWAEIQSKSRRIDQGIHDQIGNKTMEIWKKVKSIQMDTKLIEVDTNNTLKVVQGLDRRQLLQSLKVTGNAIFDSRETMSVATPCLRGTQVQTLRTIQEWAEDPEGEMILWLDGMAGTGKTSISMTVASALKGRTSFIEQLSPPKKAFLGASFFFKSGDATRNSTVEFFTTIAWCLSDVFPGLDSPFTKAMNDNPGIEKKAPQEQFLKLIAEPLELLDKNNLVSFQLIVVIDALDECDDAETLLAIIGKLRGFLHVRLRFFITSRREEHISSCFRTSHRQSFRSINLKKVESSPGEDDDITLYLSKTLKEIAARYDAQDNGIGDADIKRLAEKADGLFIYAVTACRYLHAPDFANQESRNIRLNLILEEIEGPQQEVDSIYLTVLKFPNIKRQNKALRYPFYSRISQLIGLIVVSLRPVSVKTLGKLLRTTKKELSYYLGYLHPIINVPDDSSAPISLVHLSFRDFILNEKRSGRLSFSVNEPVMHREMFHRCLEIMDSKLREDICLLTLPGTFVSDIKPSQIEARIPQYLRYACQYWVVHLKRIGCNDLAQPGLNDDDELVHRFLQKNLLYWLEKPETQESWGSELYTLQGHSGWMIVQLEYGTTSRGQKRPGFKIQVNLNVSVSHQMVKQIAFSPAGHNVLASLCGDGRLRIWDLDDRQQDPIQYSWTPDHPLKFVFSPDGRFIAVSRDNQISLVHVTVEELISEFEVENEYCSVSMAISTDSRIIAVRRRDSIGFWDITLSEPKLARSYRAPRSKHSPFLSLLPDEKLNLRQDNPGTIEICDVSTSESIGKFLTDFGEFFSRDGSLMAVVPDFHSVIQIFSDSSATLQQPEMINAPRNIAFLFEDSVALSYGGREVTETKRWNVIDGDARPLQDYVKKIVFSPDRECVILQLNTCGKFQVWDKTLTHLQATFDDMAGIAFIPHTGELATLSRLGDFKVLGRDAGSGSFKLIRGFGLHDVVFETIPKIGPLDAATLHLSPSGQEAIVIVPGYYAKSCQLWNLAEKKRIKETSFDEIYDITFSSGNEFFGVQRYHDRGIQLFHMSNGEEVHNCDLHKCHSLTFHPADNVFAVASQTDHGIVIWEGLPWIKKFTLEVPQDHTIKNLHLSASGKIAALSTPECINTSTIHIWDIATREKLGSRVFELSGDPLCFRFSIDETFFESNRGRMPMPIQYTTRGESTQPREGLYNCLYVLDDWICQGHERLIWLPPAYRPWPMGEQNVDVRGGTVALVHQEQSVTFIRVSLDKTPVARFIFD
ncbi:hypothetical protein FGRMN_6352 [Fusarium graminum]|nr:hypothetical protein FGRMN_6352 [Fusarium graminum]